MPIPDYEAPISAGVIYKICSLCGGLVVDQDVHNGFHMEYDMMYDAVFPNG